MASPEEIEVSTVEFPGCAPIELSRGNTRLFTFWGRNAMYDHVFVDCEGESHADESATPNASKALGGHYVFRDEEAFGELAGYAVNQMYELSLNMATPSPSDMAAYNEKHWAEITQAIGDTF